MRPRTFIKSQRTTLPICSISHVRNQLYVSQHSHIHFLESTHRTHRTNMVQTHPNCRNFHQFLIHSHSITTQLHLLKPRINAQCHSLTHTNRHKHALHHISHHNIHWQTVILTGGIALIIKKFVGYKFLQWMGWRRLYRWYYRYIIKCMAIPPKSAQVCFVSESKESKQLRKKLQLKQRMLGLLNKSFRKSSDFINNHPRLTRNVIAIDYYVTNGLLWPWAKFNAIIHWWLRGVMSRHKVKFTFVFTMAISMSAICD